MRNSLGALLMVLVVGAGAACTASATAHHSAPATTPALVVISPGVQVIDSHASPQQEQREYLDRDRDND